MKLLKWLSVTDRFYKIYLDKQLAPFGINNSQYMFLIKICRSDRKSTRLNSSHMPKSRMPSSA